MFRLLKKMITSLIDWFLYKLISEKQKRFLSNLFNDQQKETLKKISKNGKRHAQKQKIKQIKHHLYNLGFIKRGLEELETIYKTTTDSYMKRIVAWELTLWHANKNTPDGARQALKYIPTVIEGEKDKDQLRKTTIIKAECLERLGKIEEGKRIIREALDIQKHPDLYMAAVNLEEKIDKRIKWINKAMDIYNLQHISFTTSDETVTYDDLKTNPIDRKIEDGPKVSIILPAFKAESGIRIAIESILTQTWKNIELLAVDDHSPDHTVEVIKEYVEKDKRVKLLSTPKNSGPYVARNIALKEATGEFVTINDSDDWSHTEKIEIQVKHLMENKNVIANTSEHARLTEQLQLYRRGTPGKYIFSNMSSLMFRRDVVVRKIGYWDCVRFAADGEFKRRLIKEFGKNNIVDLKTGPLSLPRQSVSSLTGSSAFGYNGFFMGVRKEYVENLELYHNKADTLYFPYSQEKRIFPVPEPMWPDREEKPSGCRYFDIVFAFDFRTIGEKDSSIIEQIEKQKAKVGRIGLIQMNRYDLSIESDIATEVRELIDGDQVQMLVYGERIETEELIILNPVVLEDWQKYIPEVEAQEIYVLVNQLPIRDDLENPYSLKQCLENLKTYFGKTGIWKPVNEEVRKSLIKQFGDQIHSITLASNDRENRTRYAE